MPSTADNNSFEQWLAEGGEDADTRATATARRMLGGPAAGLAPRLGKIVLASAACGGVAFGLAGVLPGGAGVAERLLRGLVPVAAGAAAYFLAGRLLRSTEILALSRIGRRVSFDEGAGRS